MSDQREVGRLLKENKAAWTQVDTLEKQLAIRALIDQPATNPPG